MVVFAILMQTHQCFISMTSVKAIHAAIDDDDELVVKIQYYVM